MQPRILMCPPDYYGIEYEINPWMSRSPERSARWRSGSGNSLRDTLRRARGSGRADGAAARPARPRLHRQRRADLSTPRSSAAGSATRSAPASRRTSTPGSREHGFTVEHLPEGMYYEGAGDALFCGETLFAGYRIRSDAAAHQWLGEKLGVRVLPLELVNPRFYHLDTCFCPLAPGEAIYFPDAFDAYGRRVLEDARAEAHRGERGGSAPLRVQRGGRRQDGGPQRRCPRAGREPASRRATGRSRSSWTSSSRPAAARSA